MRTQQKRLRLYPRTNMENTLVMGHSLKVALPFFIMSILAMVPEMVWGQSHTETIDKGALIHHGAGFERARLWFATEGWPGQHVRAKIESKRTGGLYFYSTKNVSANNNLVFETDYDLITFHTRSIFDTNVGIGTTDPGSYKLAVEGKIGARGIDVKSGSWADFVFAEDYTLRPLDEVEQFIQRHQHLPEIPSEAQVLEKGLDVGEMLRLQMQKIEELTLYLIQLKKENESLKQAVNALQHKE